MIIKYGKTRAKSSPEGSKKTNNIWNCISLQIILDLYFKKSVALSILILICNCIEEIFLPYSSQPASLLLRGSYILNFLYLISIFT